MTFTKELLLEITELAKKIDHDVTFMEVCGGHTNTIMKYGIRESLPKNIRLISGPGCPVCVSAQKDIDCMIELAAQGIPIATYGDMLRVPGSKMSLDDARAKGGNIHMIYSTTEVIELKKKYPEIIFFGIGFETTAPMTAFLLKNNVTVYSVHKVIPPAMKALVLGEVAIDGFIDPGHVSTIIGTKPYEDIDVAQVISGFKPEEMLRAIYLLVKLIYEGKKTVVNGYPELVRTQGNKVAQDLLDRYFKLADSEWRGLGTIPMSGLEVRDDRLNAKKIHKEIIEKVAEPKKTGCRCGEILKGIIEPPQCPLFVKACDPENPQGACMVSEEGTCQIAYRYRENERS